MGLEILPSSNLVLAAVAAAAEPPKAEILKSKRADYRRTWQARLKTPEPTDAARLAWWEKAYGLTP